MSVSLFRGGVGGTLFARSHAGKTQSPAVARRPLRHRLASRHGASRCRFTSRGALRGPGVFDMKGGLVQMLYARAVKDLGLRPRPTVWS
jgi:hypothetical protein